MTSLVHDPTARQRNGSRLAAIVLVQEVYSSTLKINTHTVRGGVRANTILGMLLSSYFLPLFAHLLCITFIVIFTVDERLAI